MRLGDIAAPGSGEPRLMFHVQTSRLVIRDVSLSDLDFVAELLGHPEVMRYWPRPYTRVEAAESIERQRQRYRDHGYGYWLAIDRALNCPIGQVGLIPTTIDEQIRPHLGYIIHRPYWRRGYAREGSTGVLQHAFGAMELSVVECTIRPENAPSLALAESLGFQQLRIVQHYDLPHWLLSLDAVRFREMSR